MIDVLQQIRNGCVPRRPTPQKKALATADLVREADFTGVVKAFSAGDPVTMESVRHALRKLHSSDGLALEVRGIDYY